MNYRSKQNSEVITSAVMDEENVLVHVACAEANPETVATNGIDYQFEDGKCCAVCGTDLLHFPDIHWPDAALEIMREIENSDPGGGWEEKFVYLNKDGTGRRAANVYYPADGAAPTAVLYPDAATSTEWEA